ncbi:MAG TPA: hypothetical protein HA346_05140 [Thermoplasmata archaeon]|nr:hypothetical protein [Thermoplasmata archaeon]
MGHTSFCYLYSPTIYAPYCFRESSINYLTKKNYINQGDKKTAEKIKKAIPILVSFFILLGFISGCVEKSTEEKIKQAAKFQPPKIPPLEPIEKKEKPPEEEAGMMEKIMGNPCIGNFLGCCVEFPCLGHPALNFLCSNCCCPFIVPCLNRIL